MFECIIEELANIPKLAKLARSLGPSEEEYFPQHYTKVHYFLFYI